MGVGQHAQCYECHSMTGFHFSTCSKYDPEKEGKIMGTPTDRDNINSDTKVGKVPKRWSSDDTCVECGCLTGGHFSECPLLKGVDMGKAGAPGSIVKFPAREEPGFYELCEELREIVLGLTPAGINAETPTSRALAYEIRRLRALSAAPTEVAFVDPNSTLIEMVVDECKLISKKAPSFLTALEQMEDLKKPGSIFRRRGE